MTFVVLDSHPLGMLTQSPEVAKAAPFQEWLADKIDQGLRPVVPEIVDYELRRELIRAGKGESIRRLDKFIGDPLTRFLPLTTPALRLAAELWAKTRQRGKPTSDVHALDVDVILAAQTIVEGYPPGEFVVATSNVAHLSLFVPARLWSEI